MGTNFADQKRIAGILDMAADKAYDGYNEATGKQCWFLAKLMLADGLRANKTVDEIVSDVMKDFRCLTKREASKWIDALLNGRHYWIANEQDVQEETARQMAAIA